MNELIDTDKKNFIIKTLLLSLIFLLLLLLFFPLPAPLETTHDHELSHETQKKDTIISPVQWDDPLEGIVIDIESILENNTHSSAVSENIMSQRLELVCEYYNDLCDITQRQDDHSLEQQYYYQILMIYLIKNIDRERKVYATSGLRDTLTSISMYKNPTGRRGSAGTTHVRMNTQKIDNYREFWEVFTHEVWWHIHDLWVLDDPYSPSVHPDYTEFGEAKFGLNDWSLKFYSISWLDENTRRPDASFEDFVSGYAMKDTFEELAEFTNAWINHHDLLINLASKNDKIQQKYTLYQELFGERYFDADSENLNNFDDTQRVFDTTKPWKNK